MAWNDLTERPLGLKRYILSVASLARKDRYAQEADFAKLHSQNSFRALPGQSGHAEPQKIAAFAVCVAENRLSHVCLGWQAREWLLPIVGFTCCFSQLVVPASIWTPPWIIIKGEGNG
ncbi:hypothetical protein [uncultured Pelagimonas sp.]|uniref:hypothetical protein n=1 Tax=uncultured Pelagimonas sp. TaxID=1618102 RepID=UPI00261551EA|nr:hypothetical protein [uncultured Pelagimonas sp.]